MKKHFISLQKHRLPALHRFFVLRRPVLSAVVFLAVIWLFVYGLSSVSAVTIAEQKKSLEDALRRNIIDCYTTMGVYPESLDYLMEHYPLSYDRELFFVDYQPIASNLMPDVTVIVLP